MIKAGFKSFWTDQWSKCDILPLSNRPRKDLPNKPSCLQDHPANLKIFWHCVHCGSLTWVIFNWKLQQNFSRANPVIRQRGWGWAIPYHCFDFVSTWLVFSCIFFGYDGLLQSKQVLIFLCNSPYVNNLRKWCIRAHNHQLKKKIETRSKHQGFAVQLLKKF